MIFFALTLASGVLFPPPQEPVYELIWRADIYERGRPPIRNAPVPALLDLEKPYRFNTKTECRYHATPLEAVAIMETIRTTFPDADVRLRFECRRVGQ